MALVCSLISMPVMTSAAAAVDPTRGLWARTQRPTISAVVGGRIGRGRPPRYSWRYSANFPAVAIRSGAWRSVGAGDNGIQVTTERGVDRPQSRHVLVKDAIGQVALVVGIGEQAAAGQELPEDDTKAAAVGRRADFQAGGGELFGSGVTQGAQHAAGAGGGEVEALAFGEAKIHEDHTGAVGSQHEGGRWSS